MSKTFRFTAALTRPIKHQSRRQQFSIVTPLLQPHHACHESGPRLETGGSVQPWFRGRANWQLLNSWGLTGCCTVDRRRLWCCSSNIMQLKRLQVLISLGMFLVLVHLEAMHFRTEIQCWEKGIAGCFSSSFFGSQSLLQKQGLGIYIYI